MDKQNNTLARRCVKKDVSIAVHVPKDVRDRTHLATDQRPDCRIVPSHVDRWKRITLALVVLLLAMAISAVPAYAHDGDLIAAMTAPYAAQADVVAGQPLLQTSSSNGITTVWLNLRSGPGTSYAIITTLAPNTRLTIHEQQRGWYRVSTSGGTSGWVSAPYVNVVSSAPPTSGSTVAVVTGSVVNLRTGPATTYHILTTVGYGTQLQALARNNGWYKVQTPSRTIGWIAGWLVRIDPTAAQRLPFEDVNPPAPTPSPVAFPSQQLRATLDRAGGTWGAVVYDTTNGTQRYTQNATTVFPAASVIKVPIAIAIYHQAQQGRLNVNERLTMRAADVVGGTGSIRYDPVGTSYTIRELCHRMLRDSDNTAGNMLLKRIGMEAVNSLMTQIGARQTRVQRLFMDFQALQAGRDNLTSTSDMLLVLQALERGDLTGATGAQEILAAMHQAPRTHIPALLPSSVPVAHKFGTLTRAEHDVGIVYLPTRRYMVVMLSRDISSNAAGTSAIAEGSRLVYAWFTR